jgi:hypothetical protein
MTTERDEGTEALVAAVLRGDPGAADRLLRHMTVHAINSGPLQQRAERELAATHDELEDLLRQVRFGGDHLAARADVLLEERAAEQEGGICDDCLARLEEEADRAAWYEAMRVIDQGGPWY